MIYLCYYCFTVSVFSPAHMCPCVCLCINMLCLCGVGVFQAHVVQRWLMHQDSSLSGEGSSETQGGKWHFDGRVNILVLPLFLEDFVCWCGFFNVSVCGSLVVVQLVEVLVFECRDVANNFSQLHWCSCSVSLPSLILNDSYCVLCMTIHIANMRFCGCD